MRFYRLVLISVCVLILSACASSRKATTKVSVSNGDSVSVSKLDSSAMSVVRKDSITVGKWDHSQVVCSAQDYNDDEELIHELITESVDSLGNKVKTTDRTIHRKNHNGKQTTTNEQQRKREEQTSVYLSMLDSVANSRFFSYDTHWQNKDSLAQNSEKNTNGNFSPLRRIEDAIIFFVVVALLGWLVARRINNKKH